MKVSSDGIEPDTERLKGFVYQAPKTKKALQRILGLINWYRPFIKSLSQKIVSVTDKLKEKGFKTWNENDNCILKGIFQEIKAGLKLYFPKESERFILETDASEVALGAILHQNGKLIGIYSKKLNDVELRYPIQEKEALGVIRALEHFRTIIFNSPITIRCDNRNLLFDKQDIRQKTQRWKILLSEYDHVFEAIKGKDNIGADYLSRMAVIEVKEHFEIPLKEIASKQLTDQLALSLREKAKLELVTLKGIKLLVNLARRIYIPEICLKNIIRSLHLELGHCGSTKLYGTICKFFTANKLLKTIKKINEECEICLKSKASNYRYGIQQKSLHTINPMTTVSTDILGPFSTEIFSNDISSDVFYFISIIDNCTRTIQVKLVTEITSQQIIDAF